MDNAVAILGAGMAGYGAAYHLDQAEVPTSVYEKRSSYGGHTSSFTTEKGFIFDEGPHVSFTEDTEIQKFLAEAVNHEYDTLKARFNNYWQGYWIKHPVQVNLHGLPVELQKSIVRDYFAAYHSPPPPERIDTFEDWLIASYGATLAQTFPMVYGKKYHTTEASNMTTDWLGSRLYTPEPDELLQGLLSPNSRDVHYVDHFRYPKTGGFQSYLSRFPAFESAVLHFGHEVVRIDPREGVLTFSNGEKRQHEHIISSIPLPSLIPMIGGVPDDVKRAARTLAYTRIVLVSLGVDRSDLSDAHVTYFYDPDIPFARVSFPHMFSAGNAPEGTGSIQAEIYFSDKYKPLHQPLGAFVPIVIDHLKECGILNSDNSIVDSDVRLIPYANVIFDLDRSEALETVHGFLDDIGISYCGRYGEWDHIWTDESFRSGQREAQKIESKTCKELHL